MAPIHVQRLGPQRTDLGPWFLGRWGGGVYTQQTLSLTKYIIRNQNYSEWQLLSSGETLLWSLAAAQRPKWSKMVPKLTIWNIQAARDYLKWYQHWQFGASGDHGSNICIEIGARANRRRAEGCLYVWETAFTVQRALCTFRGKGHPVQRALRTFIGKGTMAPI